MSSTSGSSTAVITKLFNAGQTGSEESGWLSQDPEGKTKIKVLAIDEANNTVDFLLWLASDSGSGNSKHTHGGETYAYIIEGGYSLTSFTDFEDEDGTTIRYNKGDFVYQPFGQIHIEILGAEDTLLYVSNRGSKNGVIFEGFDEDGNVTMTQKIADMAEMLKT